MESSSARPEYEGNAPTTYNLLFVCSGNTCRSPLARAITEKLVRERGWNHVRVDSAGTGAVEGAPAAANAIAVAAEAGLDLTQHRSKELTPGLVAWADLVLVMTPSQFETVAMRGGGAKLALISEFSSGSEAGEPVQDPFGGDLETYRETYQQLHEAATGMLARLEPILAP